MQSEVILVICLVLYNLKSQTSDKMFLISELIETLKLLVTLQV